MTVYIDINIDPFAKDVLKGLSANPKRLFSKYFYDDAGSRIFQEIMDMPEYYPTSAELEILTDRAEEIHQALGFDTGFNIVELGAGDGLKTKAFLKYLVQQNTELRYLPLDISAEAMRMLQKDLKKDIPQLAIQPLIGDYFTVLNHYDFGVRPGLFMFLGGNIGNYETHEAISLLRHFGKNMKKGDQILVGFDLKKNPRTVRQAYDDPQGITKRFNLNLLNRINKELGANFNLDQFDFYADYNPETGEVRSYIISLIPQKVRIEALRKTFTFKKDEFIFTELSRKYDLSEIKEMASKSGFVLKQNFLDSNELFTDSLWEKSI